MLKRSTLCFHDFEAGTRHLEAEVLNGNEFAGFLTVSCLDGAVAAMTLINNFARYSSGLGASRALSGRVFGFFEETVDEQLPPLVLIPAGADVLREALTPEEIQVPTREQIMTHYALPAAATLMPGLGPNGNTADLCRIVPVPTPWAPYFMNPMSPVHGEQWEH
jgi:hypothetical protein